MGTSTCKMLFIYSVYFKRYRIIQNNQMEYDSCRKASQTPKIAISRYIENNRIEKFGQHMQKGGQRYESNVPDITNVKQNDGKIRLELYYIKTITLFIH